MSQNPNDRPYQSPEEPPGPPPVPPYVATSQVSARVANPALALMIAAGIGIGIQLLMLVVRLLGVGFGALAAGNQEEAAIQMIAGGAGIVFGLLGIGVGVVIFYGAMRMRAMQGYSLAVASSILAMVPCLSPCCVLGLPLGIWSLVVLLDPTVKEAFHS